MAVLALPAIAAAATTAGTVTATVVVAAATAAGALIDQMFIFPAIFGGPPDQKGPRLDDLRVQTASEGSPTRALYGPATRTAGTVIWTSTLRELKTSKKVGGKGGGGTNVTEYTYEIDMAVAVCEGRGTGGIKSDALKRIYAEGKVIYNRDTPSATGKCTILKRVSYKSWGKVSWVSGTDAVLQSNPASGGIDLQDLFTTGYPVTIAGFGNSNNNGSFNVKGVGKTSAGLTYLEISNSNPTTEGSPTPVDNVTVSQPTVPKFDKNKVKAITFYPGSESQAKDSIISALMGSANTPAFRGTAYVMIQGLKLADFGNRPPVMEMVMEADASLSVRDCIALLLDRGGRTSADYDVSLISSGLMLDGYQVEGPGTVRGNLEPLLGFYNLLLREDNGKLVFFHRTAPSVVAIPESDLASHEAGSDPPKRRVPTLDGNKMDMPAEVNVGFPDKNARYQRGVGKFRRINSVNNSVWTRDFTITTDKAKAEKVAQRVVWTAWINNRRYEPIQLPPSYLHVQEGDVLTLTDEGEPYRLLVMEVTRGFNWVHVVRGVDEQAQSLVE